MSQRHMYRRRLGGGGGGEEGRGRRGREGGSRIVTIGVD